MAFGDHALQRHGPRRDYQRRPQLCLRPVCREDHAGAAPDAGPEQVGRGLQRRGAGPRRDAGPVHRGLRAVRFPPGGVLPLLRAGRGHADRFRRLREASSRDPQFRGCHAGRRPGGRRPARRRRGPRPGRLRKHAARPADRDCRPPADDPLGGRGGRGDLGARAERRPGILAPAGGDGGHVRGLSEGHRRGPVPAHRRPGIHQGRGAVRHRTAQRPDHHPRPQPLPAGH